MRKTGFEALALALAVTFIFGSVVPGLYVTSDDGMMSDLLAGIHRRHPGLASTLHAVIFEAAGMGHFTPVHQTFKAAAYHFAGPEGWSRAVLAFYLLLHAASAILLFILLRRMAAPGHVGMLAAAAFSVHPVLAEPLSCALFAYNVPGLFFLLAACLLWCGPGDALPGPPRLAAGTVFLLLSMGCNPNFLITAPLMMVYMAVRRGGRRERGRIAAALLCVIVAVGLTAAHRMLVYGTLTTKQPEYRNIEPYRNPVHFAGGFLRSVVMLQPSRTARLDEGSRNPSVLPRTDFTVRSGSPEFVLLLALTACICALATRRDTDGVSYARPMLFGAALTLFSAAPYLLFLGAIDVHRYTYPSVAGAAVVVVTALGYVVRRIFPGHVAFATAIAMAPVLFILMRTGREAVHSIAQAHGIARTIVSQIAADLDGDPAVTHLYVLGYPRVLGRAGFVYPYQWSLRRVVGLKIGRRLSDNDHSLLADLESGEVPLPLPRQVAVYRVPESGSSVERLSPATDFTLHGPMARYVWDDHVSSIRLPSPMQVRQFLASPDPYIVSLWLKSLARSPDPNVRHGIAAALWELTAEQQSARSRDSAFAGLAVPEVRANAIRMLANWPGDLRSIAAEALNDAPGSSAMRSAVSEVAPGLSAQRESPNLAPPQPSEIAAGGISLEVTAPWREHPDDRAVSSLLVVENRESQPLPRTARIVWAWFLAGEATPVAGGSRAFPHGGLASGRWRRVPCFIAMPSGGGRYDLEVSVDAAGRRLAGPVRIRNPGIGS